MTASNESITMKDFDQIIQTPTRLRIQTYPSWYALAFVSTSLQVSGDEIGLRRPHENLNSTFPRVASYRSSSTQLSISKLKDPNVETVSLNQTYETSNSEVNIKPHYIREFKIKARALRINKALPKIFLD